MKGKNILFDINTFEVNKVTKVEVTHTLIEGKRISNKKERIRKRVKIICELKITYDELLQIFFKYFLM